MKAAYQLEATLLSKMLPNSAEICNNVAPTSEVRTATMLTFVVAMFKGKCGINHNNIMFVSNVMVIFVIEDLLLERRAL